ncbi:MAG: response regulator [Deltaproteobacteria bacterium]|nr:response regulator [Deltaproteobacteria bacterium]
MKKEQIAVVEDEADIREVMVYNLERDGYRVFSARNGKQGLELIQAKKPDLVLLDLMLPGLDGLQICKLLKADELTCSIPIIMVSARGEESDIVSGLELGADDYITKPFSTREMLARVNAVLRRREPLSEKKSSVRIEYAGVTIDVGRHQVWVDDEPVAMTATEFKLLHFLAHHPGWVFTRDHLISRIMGEDNFIVDRNIDVHIQAVRKKLGPYRNLIETIRGIGYRFKERDEP